MLSDQIEDVLQTYGCLSSESIACEITKADSEYFIDAGAVEMLLISLHRRFQICNESLQRWSVSGRCIHDSVDSESRKFHELGQLTMPTPFSWQKEAFAAWEDNSYHGIVEAVTGSGKTLVGMMAIHEALSKGHKALVLVPTFELQQQWFKQISRNYGRFYRIRKVGGTSRSSFDDAVVTIAIVNSLRNASFEWVQQGDLLVADECHRYATGENSTALSVKFDCRLGLSATSERRDGGHDRYLLPYFDDVVFRYSYASASKEGVVCGFGVTFVGVPLNDRERANYIDMSETIGGLIKSFKRAYGRSLPEDDEFMRILKKASIGTLNNVSPNLEPIAKTLLSALIERRRYLEGLSGKFETLRKMADDIKASKRCIVFTQSIESAVFAGEVLIQSRVNAEVVHSKTPKELRRSLISRFRDDNVHVIVAPRILDEGIDVPDVNLAIILTASGSRLQMIQRFGRALRRKPNGESSDLVVFFAEDTVEDPRLGAHGSLIADLAESATYVRVVHSQDGMLVAI